MRHLRDSRPPLVLASTRFSRPSWLSRQWDSHRAMWFIVSSLQIAETRVPENCAVELRRALRGTAVLELQLGRLYPNWDGTAVMFDLSNGNIEYAALEYDHVYKSLDTGKTWARIDGTGTNVLPTNVGRIALSIAPSSPSTLYAGFQDAYSYNLLGFFKTIDGGANWV